MVTTVLLVGVALVSFGYFLEYQATESAHKAVQLIHRKKFQEAKTLIDENKNIDRSVFTAQHQTILDIGLNTAVWSGEHLPPRIAPGMDICDYTEKIFSNFGKKIEESDSEFFERTQNTERKPVVKEGVADVDTARRSFEYRELRDWYKQNLDIDFTQTSLLFLKRNKANNSTEKLLHYDVEKGMWRPNPDVAILAELLSCARKDTNWLEHSYLNTDSEAISPDTNKPFEIPMSAVKARTCSPIFLIKAKPSDGIGESSTTYYARNFKVTSSIMMRSLPTNLEKIVIVCEDNNTVARTINFTNDRK